MAGLLPPPYGVMERSRGNDSKSDVRDVTPLCNDSKSELHDVTPLCNDTKSELHDVTPHPRASRHNIGNKIKTVRYISYECIHQIKVFLPDQ